MQGAAHKACCTLPDYISWRRLCNFELLAAHEIFWMDSCLVLHRVSDTCNKWCVCACVNAMRSPQSLLHPAGLFSLYTNV